MKIRRQLFQFCFLPLALFSGQAIQAQTQQTLSFSVQAYDKLLSQLAPGQEDVSIGDMRYTVDKLTIWRNHLYAKLNNQPVLQGAFDFSRTTPWPAGVVPYTYDASVPDSVKTIFESAIREWQINASVNFVQRVSEPNYLLIKFTGYQSGAVMNSWIGVRGKAQDLNVAGWGVKIDCAHELGHALGMVHEQCRSNRDDFVTVFPANMTVDPAVDVNFAIVPSAINRTAYDYDSLMHYPRDGFAKPGMVSLLAKSPNQSWSDGIGPQEIGQKTHLSIGDKTAMAAQYGAPLKIGGRIVDAANAPLAGVRIVISGGSSYRGPNPVSTDANGNYEFNGIPRNSGTYTLTPNQPGTSFTQASRSATVTTASQTTVGFTSIDSAPPELTIITPAISGVYSTFSTVTGTASDAVGLREVRVALARTSDLVWWNFRDGIWGGTTFDWASNVRIATGTSNWSANLPTLTVGGYQVHVQSVDISDNASPWRFRHFFIDPEPPMVTVTDPANNSFIPAFTILRGTASDGAGTGISNSIVQFTLYQNGDFWTGFNWKSNTTSQDPDVLLFADVVGGVWGYNNLPGGNAERTGSERAGTYYVSIYARDNAGNNSTPVSGVTSVQFTVDNTPPSVAIISPATGSTISNLTTITGTMQDGKGVVSVHVYLLRYADNAFWDGNAWAGGGSAILPVSINTTNGTWTTTGPLPSVNTINPANRLSNGGYDIIAFAVDAAGNQRRIDSVVTIEFYLAMTYTRGSFSDPNPAYHNELWDNPANWSPAGVPGDQELAIVNNFNPQIIGTRTVRRLDFRDGTISGGTLVIPAQGRMDWSGGVLQANLVANEGAFFNLSGAADRTQAQGTISSAGIGTWSGSGRLNVAGGIVFSNSGTFTVVGDPQVFNYTGGTPVFNNTGTFLKAGGTNTVFLASNGGMAFNNNGIISVQSGILALGGGGSGTNGTFNVAAGSMLDLTAGAFFLSGNSGFGGAGTNRVSGATVTFGGGASTLSGGNNFEVASGNVAGGSSFAGTGAFNWTGGSINANLSLPTGVSFNLGGDDERTLAGGMFTSAGPGTWTGSGKLNVAGGSVFSNSGTFTVLGDAPVFNYTGGTPVFINNGTFLKAGGANTAFLPNNGGMAFNNNGIISVQNGILALGGGGSGTNGTFNVAAGSMLDLTAGAFFLSGNSGFGGAGTNRVSGATVTFGGGASTLSEGNNFEVASGNVAGGSSFVGSGAFNWTGGSINANLSLSAGVSFNLGGDAERTLAGGIITSAGPGSWTGSGKLNVANGSVFSNSGTFTVLGDAPIFNYTGGTPVFINNGTFLKAGGANTAFLPNNGGMAFNNNGIISVQNGILALGGGGSGTNGTFNVAAGSMLDMTAGAFFLSGNTGFGGTGTNRVSGATVTFGGGASTLSEGNNFEVASGNVAGGSSFAGAGAFNWTGGSINANLSLSAGVSFNLVGDDERTLAGGIITSAGPGTWTGSGKLNVANGSVFSNSGTFTVLGDAPIFNYTGGTPVFINNGTFLKAGGANTAFLPNNGGMAFNNNGIISVQSGILALGGGGSGTNGTFNVAAGSMIDLTAGAFFLNGNSGFGGAGTNRVSGATVTFVGGASTLSGGNNFEMASGNVAGGSSFAGAGAFNWTGGSINANLSLSAGVSFNLGGDAERTLAGGMFTSAGPGTWTGSGKLNVAGGSVFSNSGTFTVLGDAPVFNYTGGSPVFNNTGTFIKAGGANTAFLPSNGGMAFNNNGIVDLRSGVLALGGGYTPSPKSQLKLALGGLLAGTQYSQLNLGGSAALAGTLSVSLANGFSPTNGSSFAIVNYGSFTGQFSSQQLPTLSLGRVWKLDYSPSALMLSVEQGQTQGQTLLRPSVGAGGLFGFDVTGPAASSVTVLASTNLVNWDPIFTNAQFNGSVHFSDPQWHQFTNRFYQIFFQK